MAVESTNILQFSMSGTYLGQTWMNVFHYAADVNGDTSPLADILANFTLEYIANVMPFMSGLSQLRFTDAKNLSNGIDIASGTPVGVVGQSTGEGMPAFVAYAFRMNRTSGLTRHGHKRFAGVSENDVNGGVANEGRLPALQACATFLAAPIIEGDVTIWPVIIGRFPQEHAQAGELDLSKVNSVVSAAYIGLTTQNTRKPGRGI